MTPKEDEAAAKWATNSLERPAEDLLKDIYHQYNIAHSKNDPTQINRTLAYFSALLIKFSRQAEESTEKTIKLTKQLYYLTWLIAILTAILLLVTFFEFPKKTIFGNQKTNQTEQYTQQHETNKKNEIHK